MGKMKELFEEGHDPLYKALGFESPNDLSVAIANRILKAGKDALTIAKIAKTIRNERFIRVCCACQKYFDNGEWVEGNIPIGKQSHGYCPECFEEIMKEIKAK